MHLVTPASPRRCLRRSTRRKIVPARQHIGWSTVPPAPNVSAASAKPSSRESPSYANRRRRSSTRVQTS
eukprot:3556115-Pyramimonas_sp.AAC.1